MGAASLGKMAWGARPYGTARSARSHRGQHFPGDVSNVLFPKGEPLDLPDTLEAGGERMSMAWAVSVLMGNRDAARRYAAESGVPW